MKRLIATMLLIACAAVTAGLATPPPGRPVDIFKSLDGTWEGTFIGYGADGRELYRIAVRQHYRTVSDSTQMVDITDRMSDGTVIRGRGQNVASRQPDGSLKLTCEVKKSNGDNVRHDGRIVEGVDGAEQIIWHSSDVQRTETFREHVYRDADGKLIYEINGMGRYGTTMMLMHGRYVKQMGEVPELPTSFR